MCPTCGQRVPYAKRRKGARYCSRACYRLGTFKTYQVLGPDATLHVLRLLNRGTPFHIVAEELGTSKSGLRRFCSTMRIQRVEGIPHRPGCYAIVHWKNPRQLSLF